MRELKPHEAICECGTVYNTLFDGVCDPFGETLGMCAECKMNFWFSNYNPKDVFIDVEQRQKDKIVVIRGCTIEYETQ